MAQNQSRSLNSEWAEGASDGKYKKVVMDRGGSIDPATYADRAALNDTYYGIHEARTKVLPDGTVHITPDFVTTPLAHLP
jgi:hypothetical protein